MIKKTLTIINDFSGGQDTKTPIIAMPLTKSPNMRNWHCAGVPNRLKKRGGYAKVNSSTVESDNLDAYYSPGYQTTDYALRDTTAHTEISQGFKANTSDTVTQIKLWLKSEGTPAGTDTITLEIHTDASGVPSGTPVANATATAVDISDSLTSSYAWITFTFATNPTLVSGTQYHLVLTGAFTVSAVNYVEWGVDDYDIIFPDGSMSVYDGSTWVTDSLYDACFEVYVTGGEKGNDGVALWDFWSKNMLLGVFGTTFYKMDKDSTGDPDGVWDVVGGGSAWDSYTKLMLHGDGVDAATTITDEIGNTMTAVNDTQIDTAQKVFGTASILFDGAGDGLTTPDDSDWDFDSSNFTIDMRVRFAALPTAGKVNILIGQYADATNIWFVGQIFNRSGTYRFGMLGKEAGAGNTGVYVNSTGLSINTWYHFEFARSGNTWYFFQDGVLQGTAQTNSGDMPNVASVLYIGSHPGDDSNPLNGWIDELRISKGIARHTANFTPPTAAYSASATPITSSRFWTMADWQSGRSLINTDIGLYTYTGTGNISTVAAAPIGKYTVIWKKYVFMAGIRGSLNTVRYSDLSDYTTWSATNTLNFDTSDGDVITGIRILKGKLYVFKRYSIHRVTYLGSNPTFQVDQVSGLGCPSHYTIKEVDMGGDLGTVLIFLTTDKKLAIFDGYNIQTISDVLTEETNDLFATADDQPLSFSDMNLTYVDLFHASVKTDTQEYILYCVLGTDTTINYAFVFDYKTGGIFPYDGQVFSASCYAVAENKAKKLYCSGYTGYTWLQESGNDDDGSDINAYWVSGKIRKNGVSLLNRNLLLGINYRYETSASTISMTLQYRFNWGVSWITPSPSTFDFDHNDELNFGKTAMFDIASINNMFQVKITDDSSNPAPTIYSLELSGDAEPLGTKVVDEAT